MFHSAFACNVVIHYKLRKLKENNSCYNSFPIIGDAPINSGELRIWNKYSKEEADEVAKSLSVERLDFELQLLNELVIEEQ